MHLESGKVRHGINKRLRCNNKKCRKHEDPFKDTIFAGSKLAISSIIRIIATFVMRMKGQDAADQCNVSQNTIQYWFKNLTERCIDSLDELSFGKIGGLGYTVEIDETHMYTNKRKIGRRLKGEKWWMVGGICRETRQIFLKMTKIRSSNFLMSLIKENVEQGTRVITDGWKGYNNLSQHDFIHHKIIHEEAFVDPSDRSIHTNTVERLWGLLKQFLSKGLPSHVIEREAKHFIFRKMIFSRKFSEIFHVIINKIIN